ncbi:hypothetical protein GJR88_00699 [Dietzia sp. DQ12-45-1b]|nr:hypothetical protein GJR88_00699 [Dietzia sp. DQ12-45-1b]
MGSPRHGETADGDALDRLSRRYSRLLAHRGPLKMSIFPPIVDSVRLATWGTWLS